MSLAKQLENVTKKMGAVFTFKNRPIALADIFTDAGLMPGLAKRADQLASLCLGYGLGVTYEDNEKSVLGKKAIFDEFTPDILRLFCIVDVLYEIINQSPTPQAVSLDELMYD